VYGTLWFTKPNREKSLRSLKFLYSTESPAMNREEPAAELKLIVRTIVSRLFSENCYLVSRGSDSRCLVIDPGLDADRILNTILENRLTPVALLITHGHADHIAGIEPLKSQFPNCPIVIGRKESPKLLDPQLNLSANYSFNLVSPPADHLVAEGDRLTYAEIDLDVYDTPGHSSGHVVYIWKGSSPWTVFGGDVLFHEGIGRTDFPDGDSNQLIESINTRLFTLPDDTVVMPGHGPKTTIGHEKVANPFVGRDAKQGRMRFV
jgi:glyoxylase-like metal-dependent hydrolase (beta-lactamase superfamily II)